VSSAYTVNEDGFMTPTHRANATGVNALGHRAASSPTRIRVLMRRSFTNIWRTPELFLSRLMVLTP
jgi:hypothetical protein